MIFTVAGTMKAYDEEDGIKKSKASKKERKQKSSKKKNLAQTTITAATPNEPVKRKQSRLPKQKPPPSTFM